MYKARGKLLRFRKRSGGRSIVPVIKETMVRIRYKTGWLRFKTIEELSAMTGWSFDRITFALKTNISIMGIELQYGEQAPKTSQKPMTKPVEKPTNYIELKNELRMVNRRKQRADRVVKKYHDSWFPGRIETNEIKHARNESARLSLEINRLKKSIAHYKRYEQKKVQRGQIPYK